MGNSHIDSCKECFPLGIAHENFKCIRVLNGFPILGVAVLQFHNRFFIDLRHQMIPYFHRVRAVSMPLPNFSDINSQDSISNAFVPHI